MSNNLTFSTSVQRIVDIAQVLKLFNDTCKYMRTPRFRVSMNIQTYETVPLYGDFDQLSIRQNMVVAVVELRDMDLNKVVEKVGFVINDRLMADIWPFVYYRGDGLERVTHYDHSSVLGAGYMARYLAIQLDRYINPEMISQVLADKASYVG
jgi:hypothetical protein